MARGKGAAKKVTSLSIPTTRQDVVVSCGTRNQCQPDCQLGSGAFRCLQCTGPALFYRHLLPQAGYGSLVKQSFFEGGNGKPVATPVQKKAPVKGTGTPAGKTAPKNPPNRSLRAQRCAPRLQQTATTVTKCPSTFKAVGPQRISSNGRKPPLDNLKPPPPPHSATNFTPSLAQSAPSPSSALLALQLSNEPETVNFTLQPQLHTASTLAPLASVPLDKPLSVLVEPSGRPGSASSSVFTDSPPHDSPNTSAISPLSATLPLPASSPRPHSGRSVASRVTAAAVSPALAPLNLRKDKLPSPRSRPPKAAQVPKTAQVPKSAGGTALRTAHAKSPLAAPGTNLPTHHAQRALPSTPKPAVTATSPLALTALTTATKTPAPTPAISPQITAAHTPDLTAKTPTTRPFHQTTSAVSTTQQKRAGSKQSAPPLPPKIPRMPIVNNNKTSLTATSGLKSTLPSSLPTPQPPIPPPPKAAISKRQRKPRGRKALTASVATQPSPPSSAASAAVCPEQVEEQVGGEVKERVELELLPSVGEIVQYAVDDSETQVSWWSRVETRESLCRLLLQLHSIPVGALQWPLLRVSDNPIIAKLASIVKAVESLVYVATDGLATSYRNCLPSLLVGLELECRPWGKKSESADDLALLRPTWTPEKQQSSAGDLLVSMKEKPGFRCDLRNLLALERFGSQEWERLTKAAEDVVLINHVSVCQGPNFCIVSFFIFPTFPLLSLPRWMIPTNIRASKYTLESSSSPRD